MADAELWNVTETEYHADCSKLGSTMIKLALKSPAKYRRCFVDENALAQKTTPDMTLGSAVHCLTLEPEKFLLRFCVKPEVDGRTTKGKEIKAKYALQSMGKLELTESAYEGAKAMANALLSDDLVHEMVHTGILEQAVVWDEDGIRCKCKPDIFLRRPGLPTDLILDIKTAEDPSPECFGSGSAFSPIRRFRYDMQLYHYTRGIQDLVGRPCAAGLIVVGKDEPFDVYLYDLTPWMQLGELWWQRGMEIIRTCRESGVWRREEQGRVITLSPTEWDFTNGNFREE